MKAWTVSAGAVAALLATVAACGEDEPYLGAHESGGSAGCEEDCGGASPAGEGGAAGGEEDCSVEARNSYVYSVMKRYYLWYAEVGQTGRVETPTLHFEIRIGHRAVDPLHYLPTR